MNKYYTLDPLPWDSEFLGFKVARLTGDNMSQAVVDAACNEMRQLGMRLAYVVANPSDTITVETMQSIGVPLIDRKVTFVMDLPVSTSVSQANSAISLATTYSPQLESLAWQSGEYSRFKIDPHFEPHVFQQLYSQWLRNSLTGKIARQVLVFHDDDGIERALLTLGEKNGRADIGLLAVDAAMRGKRIGQSLIAVAAEQAAVGGFQEMQVVTQRDNDTACRFYSKCGFDLMHEEYIYHLWL